MKIILLTILLFTACVTQAFAGINVVATLPWVGSLAKEIGKEKIDVTVLVKPNQDAHTIEAKPSMILAFALALLNAGLLWWILSQAGVRHADALSWPFWPLFLVLSGPAVLRLRRSDTPLSLR